MIPEPITIDGRSGTVVYLDAKWHPVEPSSATMARVLFDDGGTGFFFVQSVAQKFDEAKHPRDAKGQFTETYHGTSVQAAEEILKHGILPLSEIEQAPPGYEGWYTKWTGPGKGKAFVSTSEKVAISYAASRSDTVDPDDLIAVVVVKSEGFSLFTHMNRGQKALQSHPGSWASATATEMASEQSVPPDYIKEVRMYRLGDVEKAFGHPYSDWLTPNEDVDPVKVIRHEDVLKREDREIFIAFVIPRDKKPGVGGLTQKFDEAKHPRGEDGRFIEASQPRIFNRPSDIGEVKGWAGEPRRWGWLPTAEDVEKYGYPPNQPTGKLLTGEPLTREELPETLYHVTTNAPAVESSGVLLGLLESGGLGGGQAQGVSFTTSVEDAIVIQRELRRAIQVARGDVDIDVLKQWQKEDEKAGNLPEGALDKSVGYAMDGWEANKSIMEKTWSDKEGWLQTPPPPEERERLRRSLVKDALNAYLQTREDNAGRALGQKDYQWSVPILKNPLLFGRQEQLAKLNPENVQTLTIPSAQIPEGALITTGSDKFLHEVRAYSDVPLRKLKKVAFDPRQPRDEKGRWSESDAWGMETGEAARIHASSHSGARKVAEASRALIQGQPVPDDVSEAQAGAAQRLVEDIRNAPEHSTVLYRGLGAEDPIESLEKLKPGDIVTLGQVSSFSESEGYAAYYANRASGGGVGHLYELKTTGPVKSVPTDSYTDYEHKEHVTEGKFEVVAVEAPSTGIPVDIGAASGITNLKEKYLLFLERSITLRQVGVF